MTKNTITAAAIAALATVSVAAAGAAPAPVVGRQTTWTTKRSPVTIPGTGLRRGARIPRGARLVFRSVTMSPGQRVTFRFFASHGRRLRGLAPSGGTPVGFTVVRPRRYVGHTSVLVRAFPGSPSRGRVTGRIYAYTR